MSLKVELLEQSFEAIKPNADAFVSSFYDNLFTANPEAKPLFTTTDMEAQKQKLLKSLVLVVENLRMPDVLENALRGLGARHIEYGALPEHYPLVGSALLTTFEQYLGDKWTLEVKQAWIDAYGAISQIMLDGADYSQVEIALEPTSSEIYANSTSGSQPITLVADSSPSNLNSFGTAEITLQPHKNQAGIYAFAGGGIMAIIAVILTMLL
ncbi:MAG TPA: globin family protein [Xenococcaceae cyanobacterium]|jgi:hemoglobin-like flavoprotein